MNVMELSVTYSTYNSFFLVLWDGEVNYNSTELHKHTHTQSQGVLAVPRKG